MDSMPLILMLRSPRRSCGRLRPKPETHNRPLWDTRDKRKLAIDLVVR